LWICCASGSQYDKTEEWMKIKRPGEGLALLYEVPGFVKLEAFDQ
jgi:hypothetical protein